MDDDSRHPHHHHASTSHDRPAPASCRMIDFETADVLYDSILGYPAVVVHGEAPYAAMDVTLRPLTYIRQPEYWGYEVIGCLPEGEVVPEVTGRLVEVLPLPGASIGTQGIAIIGANRTRELEIDLSQAGHTHERS